MDHGVGAIGGLTPCRVDDHRPTITPLEFLVLLAAAVAGGAVQSVLGFGAAVVTVPAMAVIDVTLLPMASQFAMLPLVSTMVWRGRRDIDLHGAGRMLLGRVPGVAVGAWLVVILDRRGLTIFVAAILLFAVASMARGWTIPITPRTEAAAGFTSGVTGTATGLGGPPTALLYRTVSGPRMRATLALLFLGGIAMSLSTLAVLGEVEGRHAAVGLSTGLGTVVGLFLAVPVVRRFTDDQLRRGVLVWAATGAIVAVVRALIP